MMGWFRAIGRNRASSCVLASALLFGAIIGVPPAWAAAPSNDEFAAAETLDGTLPISVSGTNLEATKEPGEPDHAGFIGGSSVWYSWTPTESAAIEVRTCDSDFSSILGVYTGDAVDDLTAVGSGFSCGREFVAAAGTTYRIAVDGFSGSEGQFSLSLEQIPPPVNDNFVAAEALSEEFVHSIFASNLGASKEAGEPDHAGDPGGASVWYSWTPGINQIVSFDTCSSPFDTLLAVYTGPDLDSLTAEASNDDGCGQQSRIDSFTASAGTTYWIAVDGHGGAQDHFVLTIAEAALPTCQVNGKSVTSTRIVGTKRADVIDCSTAQSLAPIQIDGGGGNDIIIGSLGDNRISGGAGDDAIDGGGGDDFITGGDGDDSLRGGTGDDTLDGGAGRDTVMGENGNDTVAGGLGNDTLTGGSGDDIVDGSDDSGKKGIDKMNGGDDFDVCPFSAGDEIFSCEY